TEDIEPGLDAEAGAVRRGHPAVDTLRSPVGNRDRAVAVEVGRGKAELGGRRTREMRDGGGHDVASPGIFARHRSARGPTEVAHEPCFGEAAYLGNLEIDHVPPVVVQSTHQ